MDELSQPVTAIAGVGPARARLLERLGFTTVGQLLHAPPRRYIDRSRFARIAELREGQSVTVYGYIRDSQWRRAGRDGALWLGTAILEDEEKRRLTLLWFARAAGRRMPRLSIPSVNDNPVTVSGVPRRAKDGTWQMHAPDVEEATGNSLHTGRIVPVYPLTVGLSQKVMRRIAWTAVQSFADKAPDELPSFVVARENLMSKGHALRQLHFPDSWTSLGKARRRLAFEELLFLHLTVDAQRRRTSEKDRAVSLSTTNVPPFMGELPFTLTKAQRRVLQQVDQDLCRATPMRRLLQGDVGSGKTVVVAHVLYRAAAAGFQAALLAPSDILARQHAATLRKWFASSGVPVFLLRGATTKKERSTLRDTLLAGEAAVVVGTHALLSEDVGLTNLAVLVVDEQHRFGVRQRRLLLERNPVPHLLVVSATPIPRTLARCLYGDLDVSVIDEMPPGRRPVDTRWVRPARRDEVYAFVRKQVHKGGQAFIVFPAIGEEDGDENEQLLAAAERLTKGYFASFNVEVVHGRQTPAEQQHVMERFRRGDVHVLLATSVVEVGIDVPQATIIVIEGADKFGLAQLHQLRGRVGRDGQQAYCFLIADPMTKTARKRLHVVRTTTDGFALAKHDLSLRGPGELFGLRQSGMPDLSSVAQQADLHTIIAVRRWAHRLAREGLAKEYRETPLWQAVARRVDKAADNDPAAGVH